jgi:DNA-binding CsgD family transcriptional regulator
MAAREPRGSVLGTTDDRLFIDRISTDADAEALLGFAPVDLLGRSLLTLVDEASIPGLLGALAHGFTSGQALATVGVAVRTGRGHLLQCDAVVLPMAPTPASAFAIFPDEPEVAISLTDVQRRLHRFIERVATIDLSRRVATAPTEDELPGISRLTAREREIVRRLISGDRAPAIAEALFLSPNTVRNQLSSVYRKLGVRSQQGLIDLFRVHPAE